MLLSSFIDVMNVGRIMNFEEAQQKISQANERNDTIFSLNNGSLTTDNLSKLITNNLEFFQRITTLQLRDNQLGTLPSEIGMLTKLQCLILNNNPLETIPSEIGGLIQLKYLGLPHCNIREVPHVIEDMHSLIRLSLQANPLTEATRSFLDTLATRSTLTIDYDMSAHAQVNNIDASLDKLYPELDTKNEALSKINSLNETEKQPINTFLSRIQDSKYWNNKDLFNRYFQETIRNMFSTMGYNEDGRANQVLADIVKASSGCATNGTGTIFAYYAKSVILHLQEEFGKDRIQYADLAPVDFRLRSDIIHIALQECANALINENNISADRAETIADLLRIAQGISFRFYGIIHKINNPLALPDSISGYGLTAPDRAKELFLVKLCNTNANKYLDISSNGELTISEEKLELIVNNYLSMHDINVSEKQSWFLNLSSILQDPRQELLDNEFKQTNEKIREIYQKLYTEFYEETSGNEFISSLIDSGKAQYLTENVTSEAEYLDKILNGLTEVLSEAEYLLAEVTSELEYWKEIFNGSTKTLSVTQVKHSATVTEPRLNSQQHSLVGNISSDSGPVSALGAALADGESEVPDYGTGSETEAREQQTKTNKVNNHVEAEATMNSTSITSISGCLSLSGCAVVKSGKIGL